MIRRRAAHRHFPREFLYVLARR